MAKRFPEKTPSAVNATVEAAKKSCQDFFTARQNFSKSCQDFLKNVRKTKKIRETFCFFRFVCNFAGDMPFHVPINILDFIFKGMMIGVIASAPMGPTGVLCVQRTLNKGRWYGFVTGIG